MLYITVDVDWMVRDVIESKDGTENKHQWKCKKSMKLNVRRDDYTWNICWSACKCNRKYWNNTGRHWDLNGRARRKRDVHTLEITSKNQKLNIAINVRAA